MHNMTLLDTSTQPSLSRDIEACLHFIHCFEIPSLYIMDSLHHENTHIFYCSLVTFILQQSPALLSLCSPLLSCSSIVGHALFQRLSLSLLSLHLPACTLYVRCKYKEFYMHVQISSKTVKNSNLRVA